MIKQVIVIRTDLNMRKGKMIAQGAHASMKVFFDKMWKWEWDSEEDCQFCLYEVDCKCQNWSKRSKEEDPDVYPNSNPCKAYNTNVYKTNFTFKMVDWMNSSFTKIVVRCNSEQELLDLQKQAENMHIVNALILDNGNTEFKEICPNCIGNDKFGTMIMDYNSIEAKLRRETCKTCNGTGKINKPTYTCLAIGPDDSEKINTITKGLKLL